MHVAFVHADQYSACTLWCRMLVEYMMCSHVSLQSGISALSLVVTLSLPTRSVGGLH